MKQTLKNLVNRYKLIFDILGIIIFFSLSAFFLKIYKLMGVKNLKYSTKLIKFIGIFPIRDHYYEPQFKNEYLRHKIKKPKNNSLIFNEKKINTNFFNKLKYKKELLKLRLIKMIVSLIIKLIIPFFQEGC